MNIFEQVKSRLYMSDVVKFYGLQINHSGMCNCPFHNDKTPSMKIYENNFYCFGCGEHGDVIGFTAMHLRFLCFGNGSPKALYDKSDGFARRLLILTTKPIPKGRVNNPFLAEQFIAEKEKIFCWMFDGLRRLIKNNFRFTVSEKTKKNVAEVMADNCNIIEFLNDEAFITFGDNYEASGVDLYGGYFLWCNRNALTALKKDTFIGWLHSNEEKYSIKYDTHIRNRNNERVRGFRGLKTSYVPIVI